MSLRPSLQICNLIINPACIFLVSTTCVYICIYTHQHIRKYINVLKHEEVNIKYTYKCCGSYYLQDK